MAATDLPEQLGRYRIKQRLGGGGMGAVYLVENIELGREEALKIPHFSGEDNSTVRERFLREAQAAAKMDHPNLCPIYEAGVIDGIWFLTMRHLPGKLLSAYTGRPHPPKAALKIVGKLAEALEHAHSKGVIHRDLKPGNIMMCPGTGPTVMDFGLAKHTQQQDRKLTQTGATLGTPAYMPPEQVKGELDRIGPASDVYSLGVILFELLTGRVPFEGAAGEVMGKAIFTEAPLPSELLPGLRPELDALCRRAMAKDPEDRYPSMKAFAADLMDLMQTLSATAQLDAGPIAKRNTDELLDAPTMRPGEPLESKQRPTSRQRTIPPIPVADAINEDVTIVRTASGTTQIRQEWTALPGTSLRSPWLLGLVALAMVVAVVSIGVVVLLVASRDGGRVDGSSEAASFTNSIGMKLVRIPPGKFRMGSPIGEVGRNDNEIQHDVEVSAFYLGIQEVTQKHYQTVMGKNPSNFSKDGGGKDKVIGINTDDFPVEQVSWADAMEFCKKLMAMDTRKPSDREYRLPSEAEWEYACRGGASSFQVFNFGDSLSSKQANFNGGFPYGRAAKSDYLARTCSVGSFEMNNFGLYDMHGNVWEWCADWYDQDYYRRTAHKDPSGPAHGSERVIRGGSWVGPGQDCRSAFRRGILPTHRGLDLGFRVALVPSSK